MVFDEFDFELAHQTFSGNTQDSTTLAFLVNTLKKLTDSDQELADAKPIVVVDAGIATIDNLRRLREEGFSYLVNASRQQREVYADHFRDDSGFEAVPGREKNGRARAPVLVKAVDHTFTEEATDEATDSETAPEIIAERLVLCKSGTRGNKERAMISKAEEKLLERLQKLATRIAKGQIKKFSKIHEAIGRLRSNNSRVVRFYDIDFQAAKKPAKGEPSGVLHYTRKDQLFTDSQLVMGCYVLVLIRKATEPVKGVFIVHAGAGRLVRLRRRMERSPEWQANHANGVDIGPCRPRFSLERCSQGRSGSQAFSLPGRLVSAT